MRTMTSLYVVIMMLASTMAQAAAAPAQAAAAQTRAANAPAQTDPVIFGSVPMDTPTQMAKRLTPLVKYLGDVLNRPAVLKLSPDMSSTIDAVAKGTVDFAYLTPVAYVDAHAAGNARLVATPVTKGEVTFRLMIVVAADSPIENVRDLAGKSFAFGDPAALLQRAVVYGAGMPLDKLGSYKFIGHYDNIVRSILYKDFDAGILKDTTAYMWREKGIRIIYSSPDLPPYCFVASSRVDSRTLDKIKGALLGLDAGNPEHHAVIKALDASYDGFAPTQDSDYDTVRKLIAPFGAEH